MKKQAGFLLLEFLLVFGIVAILAASSVPFYSVKLVKGKLVEVTEAMESVRISLIDFRKLHGYFPSCSDQIIIRNSLGVGIYMGREGRIKKISVENGVISTTLQNIGTPCDEKTLTLVPLIDPSTDGVIFRYGGTLVTDAKSQAYAPRK